MDTSKTSIIKSLLLQAWRERWTDIQWGINIKNVLPRGVSGDVYDLADCILQQALVGPEPNNLIISYLVHCLSSNLVSYGAVIASIGRYQSFSKSFCILKLLDLLKSFQSRIICRGNEEECIGLCKALVSITHWLYTCISHTLMKLSELKQSMELVMILENSAEVLTFILNSNFLKALFYVGKYEDPGKYAQVVQKHKEFENKFNQIQSFSFSKEILEISLNLLKSIDNFPDVKPSMTQSGVPKEEPLAFTLTTMLTIDAILNPASDIDATVDHVLLMKNLQSFSLPDLYCEIIRAGFMGLIDTNSPPLKWAAFTFLKVPQLIHKLHVKVEGSLTPEGCPDVELGIEKLLNYKPLIDLTDTKSNCDSLQFILTELSKLEVLTKAQVSSLLNKSHPEPQKSLPKQESQAGATLILRAVPTVISIFKSLETDYSRIQDALLGVLCHMVPQKNFELILSAAAATGKLTHFTSKIIMFNEYNKEMVGEVDKASQTRALLFDITFLMLSHIIQNYGTEVVTDNPETKDSFFVSWITESLAKGNRFKCPDTLLSKCNPSIVDVLLQQFTNLDSNFETMSVKWHEVCINAPMAVKEILIAWEYGALSTDTVKKILDNMKSRICSIPVYVSAWLCNYINVLHCEERLKPMNMLHQFMTPLAVDSPDTNTSGGQDQPNFSYYKERSTLMAGIIKKMMYELHPPSQPKGISFIPHNITVKTPLWDLLDEIFRASHERGWIDPSAIFTLNSILDVGGPKQFCQKLVQFALGFENSVDLHRAVNLALGMMHLDIEQCALALLLHILPNILHFESKQDLLMEPKGSALARIAVLATYSALQSMNYPSSTFSGKRFGRKNRDFDDESAFDQPAERARPNKIRRGVNDVELMEDTPYCLQSGSDDHNRNFVPEPLKRAIQDLMKILFSIAMDASICQRSLFPLVFLEQVVLCAKDKCFLILQFMPLGLVPLLVKTFPELMTHQLVLTVSSLQTPLARKVVARTLCQLMIRQETPLEHPVAK